MKFSIIITHRNRHQNLKNCLTSIYLSAQKNNLFDFEVIVVDECSSDQFWLDVILKESQLDIRRINFDWKGEFWKTKALNIATRVASDIVCYLDTDCLVGDNFVNLYQNMEDRDKVCLFLKHLPNDMRDKWASRNYDPTYIKYFFEKLDIMTPTYFAWDNWGNQTGTWPVGNSHFFCRKNDILRIGGWDERYIGRVGEDQQMLHRFNLLFPKQNFYASFKKEDTIINIKHKYEIDWKNGYAERRNWNILMKDIENNTLVIQNETDR